MRRTMLTTLGLTTLTMAGLALSACGQKNEPAQAGAADAVAVKAAAEASQVTSIPGYTPGSTPAAPGAAGGNAP